MGLLFGMLFLLAVASFLTFGTVWAEKQLKKEEEEKQED